MVKIYQVGPRNYERCSWPDLREYLKEFEPSNRLILRDVIGHGTAWTQHQIIVALEGTLYYTEVMYDPKVANNQQKPPPVLDGKRVVFFRGLYLLPVEVEHITGKRYDLKDGDTSKSTDGHKTFVRLDKKEEY